MQNKKTLTYCIAILFIFFLQNKINSQAISSTFFGQNAWMPDNIGTSTHNPNGQLDSHWQEVNDSHFTSIRIGGRGYDLNTTFPNFGPATTSQLIALINNIQVNGGEPIIQIDYADGFFSSTDAANVVTAINITNLTSIVRKVKYWSIGNEPDIWYSNGSPANNTAAGIKTYIQAFSIEMKHADPSILIIAPALSSYDPSSIMTDLIGGVSDITMMITTSGYANIDNLKYYIDYVDFHYFPFSSLNGTRALAISTITDVNGFDAQLTGLQSKINAATSRSASPLLIAITEGNINYANPTDMTPTGLSSNSFIAGQFWIEMMAHCMQNSVQFMNFWCVIEGNDLGYLRNSDAGKRATYWQYQMVANNFKGNYLANSCTTNASTYKAFAYKNTTSPNEIGVLIMNQHLQSPRGSDNSIVSFTVNFNNTVPSSSTMNFAFAAGNSTTHTGGLTSGSYTCNIQNETSMFLAFDIATGALTKNKVYSLQDASRGASDVGPNTGVGGAYTTISTQALYSGYSPTNNTNVYSDISITPSAGNPITATTNNVFQFTNSAKIDGAAAAFSSGTTGKTLCITAADATCH